MFDELKPFADLQCDVRSRAQAADAGFHHLLEARKNEGRHTHEPASRALLEGLKIMAARETYDGKKSFSRLVERYEGAQEKMHRTYQTRHNYLHEETAERLARIPEPQRRLIDACVDDTIYNRRKNGEAHADFHEIADPIKYLVTAVAFKRSALKSELEIEAMQHLAMAYIMDLGYSHENACKCVVEDDNYCNHCFDKHPSAQARRQEREL